MLEITVKKLLFVLLDNWSPADSLTGRDLHLQISKRRSCVEHDLLTLIPLWLKEAPSRLVKDCMQFGLGEGGIFLKSQKVQHIKKFLYSVTHSDLKIASLILSFSLQVTIVMHLLCTWLKISREYESLSLFPPPPPPASIPEWSWILLYDQLTACWEVSGLHFDTG